MLERKRRKYIFVKALWGQSASGLLKRRGGFVEKTLEFHRIQTEGAGRVGARDGGGGGGTRQPLPRCLTPGPPVFLSPGMSSDVLSQSRKLTPPGHALRKVHFPHNKKSGSREAPVGSFPGSAGCSGLWLFLSFPGPPLAEGFATSAPPPWSQGGCRVKAGHP